MALLVVLGALIAGFLVQQVALSEPGPATVRALRVATWFGRYRLVDSTISVNGRAAVHGRCLQDWYTVDGPRRRGAVLQLDNGVEVLDVPPHTLVVRGGPPSYRSVPALVLLELGGCPRFLQRRVATLAQQRGDLTGGSSSIGFVLKGTRISMRLDPKTSIPVQIAVESPNAHGSSRLRFGRVTPQIRRSLQAVSRRK